MFQTQTAKKKITASSIHFQPLPYGIDGESSLINYDSLASQLRAVADEHGAFLMADLAGGQGRCQVGQGAEKGSQGVRYQVAAPRSGREEFEKASGNRGGLTCTYTPSCRPFLPADNLRT